MNRKLVDLLVTVAASGAILSSQIALAAPPNACSLLSPAEIASIVAVPMGDGVALSSATTSNCTWLQQGVDASKAVTVIVSTKAVAAYEMGKNVMHPTAVSGIGDEAYLTGKSASYTALSVKKGQNALDVMVRGLKDVAAIQNAERALGKAAAAKL